MAHGTAVDLAWCEVDGHIVFLDVRGDRYFRLPADDETAFRRLARGLALSRVEEGRLAACGVPTETRALAASLDPENSRTPRRSASEDFAPEVRLKITPAVALMAVRLTLSTHRALKRGPLERVLQLAADELASVPSASFEDAKACKVVSAALEFAQIRRWMPIAPACLLDSLSLSRFLSWSGLRASVVLGVTLQPFAAHCWVQLGDVVLNDTVSNAAAHTPIKVIE